MPAQEGWYQDGNTPGIERWWDGSAWTSETRPIDVGASEQAALPGEAAIPHADAANGEILPGWYPDPEAGFRWRFWTGSSWTSAVIVVKKRGQLGRKLSAIMIMACVLSLPGSLFALYGILPTCEGDLALWEGECRELYDLLEPTDIAPVFHPWFFVGGLVAVIAAFLAIICVHKARFPRTPIRPTLQPRNALVIHGLTPPEPFESSEFQPYMFTSARSRQALATSAMVLVSVGWMSIVGAIASPTIAAEIAARQKSLGEQATTDAAEAARERSDGWVAAAAASCDAAKLNVIRKDEDALRAWLACPDPAIQALAQDTIAYEFTNPVGSTGPGGGVVFYASPRREAWGQFLEVAPANWSRKMEDGRWTAPEAVWCAASKSRSTRNIPTNSAPGAGASNTKLIIEACGEKSAAGLAAAYDGGGRHDWYLPSIYELNALGIFAEGMDGGYWSSSHASQTDDALWWNPGTRHSEISPKGEDLHVRPIRAF